MAKLGINQELEVLFNRVLNKPENEGKAHYFGACAFTFRNVKKVVRVQDGPGIDCQYSIVEQDRLYFSIASIPGEQRFWLTLDGDFKDLRDVIGRLYGEEKKMFRDGLTKYLRVLDLNEKLESNLPSSSIKPIRKI
ncbi:hypothetical protein ACTJNK_13550 [Achromobacter anxifer]